MFSSFSTALSALNANATAVDVVGNNLANLNTPGFKRSTVSFHDLVAQSMRQFTQGPIQSTGGQLDAAIQGDGFFLVRDSSNRLLYTRAGNFRMDATGALLTATGERVQGWSAVSGALNTSAPVSHLVAPLGTTRAPSATTGMSIDLNLNAGGVVGRPDGSFSTSVEIVDSLGATHVLTINFTKSAANKWDYAVTIPGDEVASGKSGQAYSISGASGSLTFDAQGQLTSPAPGSGTAAIKVTGLTNGAADLSVDWSLYGPGDRSRMTQFAQPSAVSATSQNGALAGMITRLNLTDGGRIVGQFSNGQREVLGQLALASIRNPDSLVDAGNNNLQASADTAAPAIGVPETGSRGKVVGMSLEASTVDIAREFTNLIVMQRSYQANARVITTSDELSQETINLKR